jgi:membrane protein
MGTDATNTGASDAFLRSPHPPRRPLALVRWFWRLIKDVVEQYQEDDVGDLAASITFWTLLSIPAAILALVSMLSSLGAIVGESLAQDVEDEVIGYISDTFTDSAALEDTVRELFTTSSTGIATVATLVAVFTLSRAFAGLIRALDHAYEIEEGRPWWYVRVVAIGLGVSTIVVVATGATALALLPRLPYDGVLRILTLPAILAGLTVWAATIFHIGPHHKTPWRYDVPGAIVTTIGWVLATQGFALYVRFAGGGNNVQSSIGAVLLALTLMYLLSIVLLVGAELNDVIARRAGVAIEGTDVTGRAKEKAREVRSWWQTKRADDDRPRRDPDGAPVEEPTGVDGEPAET